MNLHISLQRRGRVFEETARSDSGKAVNILPGSGWHLVLLRIKHRRCKGKWAAVISLAPAAPGGEQREILLVRPFDFATLGFKLGAFCFTQRIGRASVQLYGRQIEAETLEAVFLPIPRIAAAAVVLWQNFKLFRLILVAHSGRIASRLRGAVGKAGMGGQSLPRAYADWLDLFDRLPAERLDVQNAEHRIGRFPSISALVYCNDPLRNGAALQHTLDSIAAQSYGCTGVTLMPLAAEPNPLPGDYVAILQAGEVIPRHAFMLMAEALVRLDLPPLVFGDEDNIDSTGARSGPLFKPQPNLTMLCSGTLSRGLWLIRREVLEACAAAFDTNWAECARIAIWFHLYKAGESGGAHRIPYILTHRRFDVENAPAKDLAELVEGALQDAGIKTSIHPAWPLQVEWDNARLKDSRVTLIVPSKLRGETQLRCMLKVLENTAFRGFEMLIIVAQEGPLDESQQAAARQLLRHRNVRVELLSSSVFNYSTANNAAARRTESDFICLLNDDVYPMEENWLERMIAFFDDPNCGIVGCKLLYPNHSIQHGGVILGLSGLVDHSNRFLPGDRPGYGWRARIDHEVSAVTGACLVVRRSIFDAVGGLDERFPTALNDVDFCLRVREKGYGVVFAASVEMVHHETLTFGKHYADSEKLQQLSDAALFRLRWMRYCLDDPFHNPNLSLIPGSEWDPAYPPRHANHPIGQY